MSSNNDVINVLNILVRKESELTSFNLHKKTLCMYVFMYVITNNFVHGLHSGVISWCERTNTITITTDVITWFHCGL